MRHSTDEAQVRSPGGDAEAVLHRALSAMRPGWVLLRDCMISGGTQPAVRVRWTLLHPDVGVAMLDLPSDRTSDAVLRLRRRLEDMRFVANFGGYPPIVYRVLSPGQLYRLPEILDWAFGMEPVATPPGGCAWVTAVRSALLAEAGPGVDGAPMVAASEGWRGAGGRTSPARRSAPGMSALRRFWAVTLLVFGGGAALISYLGPQEPAAETSPADAGRFAALPPRPDQVPAWGADPDRSGADPTADVAPLAAALPEPTPAPLARDGAFAHAGGEPWPSSPVVPLAGPARLGLAARFPVDLAQQAESMAPPDPAEAEPTPPPAGKPEPPPGAASLPHEAQGPVVQEAELPPPTASEPRHEAAGAPANPVREEGPAAGPAAAITVTPPAPDLPDPVEVAPSPQTPPAAAEAPAAPTPPTGMASHPDSTQAVLPALPPAIPAPTGSAMAADPAPSLGPAASTGIAPQRSRDDEGVGANAAFRPPERPDDGPGIHPPGRPDDGSRTLPDPARRSDSAAAATLPPALVEMLVRRGDAMLSRGDISSARLLYERAAAASATAATAAGKTFDPLILAEMGVWGIQPDPAAAAAWYRKAIALGDGAAETLLRRLESR